MASYTPVSGGHRGTHWTPTSSVDAALSDTRVIDSNTIEERKVESSGSTERLRDGGCNGESSQGPFTHTDMASSSGEDASFANASSTEPRSCRVGITGPPSSFRLSSSTSNTETSDSASFSPPSSPSLFAAISPPRPPRSPLRPTPQTRRASASLLKHEQIDLSPDCDEMPLSHSRSLGSFSGLLASQPASAKSSRSVRSQTPDKPLPITPDPSISAVSVNDDDRDRDREPENDQKELEDALSVNSEFVSLSVPASGSSLGPGSFLQPRPTVSKRVHALEELLSTERAYASDLALIRDVHIPLASGLPAPFLAAPPTPPPSGPSSRTQSTSSDAPSHIPTLEPLYLAYITKHASALEHLNNLPKTPALTNYLAQSRSLASSLTHAWDLPSLLIKPVQRLLKYALLLSAIIVETPDGHLDKANLKQAREKMEEVARGVNEGRRRREVVKEVLSGPPLGGSPPHKRHSDPKPKPKKKGLNVGVSASVSLGRMKSFSSGSKLQNAKEGSEANQEAELVEKLGEEVKRCEAFARQFAKEVTEWVRLAQVTLEDLSRWCKGFGRVIGVSQGDSEAFEAFIKVVTDELPSLGRELQDNVKSKILDELTRLVDSTLAPLRLLEAMNTLEPLHFGLLNLNVAKSRPPPQLLEASQSYVALRGQLAAELPQYIKLLDKGVGVCWEHFEFLQSRYWSQVRDRWMGLWDGLKVEGEMNAGAVETVRVWGSRFVDAETNILGLNIIRPPEKKLHALDVTRQKSKLRLKSSDDSWSETSSTVIVPSILTSLDPPYEPSSSPSTLSLQTPVSGKARSVRSVDVGKSRALERRPSNESLHSKKSGKSVKSTKSTKRNPSHGINSAELEIMEYAPRAPTTPPRQLPQKQTYTRTKSMPIPSPLPLQKTQSQGRMLDLDHAEITRMRVPHHAEISVALQGDVYDDDDRGRPSRKPSFKRRLTETLRPSSASSRHQRSPSLPIGMTPSPLPSPNTSTFQNGSSSRQCGRPSTGGLRIPAMYRCQVVHACEPPYDVSYRGLPFFHLRPGDVYDVLQEAGHPSIHRNLPLQVDDGEDCLLLVRDGADSVGWALASFLVPAD
ncbi:hypothetical protein POSPLADRAFT_1066230 [Postia placenta MAD-698-R-SB12]|uniref:DH domain-containing protein n=1 Tax=Postia placenta MAD-698-R-SB12 TaxID=670580 RepID=A0A1X6MZH2_9APHY|nr:hypothetical protein POSPLADRAFT_1066230 [Postia placenta MAD-698-R-SB12]OSX61642.1 hypothetical protein POSPLADRAFT_1066230 [Postia placenta MAD-698-R-SB12]